MNWDEWEHWHRHAPRMMDSKKFAYPHDPTNILNEDCDASAKRRRDKTDRKIDKIRHKTWKWRYDNAKKESELSITAHRAQRELLRHLTGDPRI